MVYESAVQLIGNTPMVKFGNLKERLSLKANIRGKLESWNPGGSAKDRIALAMIEEAERSGKIATGATIIEPTSGNTGVGLALVAALKGYKLILTMPESMSLERQQLLRAYGATLILTPEGDGMEGAIKHAKMLHENTENSIILSQFDNPENPASHKQSTAEEVWRDTEGSIDMLVACVGTGGTLCGTSAGLKKHNPNIISVAVEPANSAVLSGGTPGKHNIQGIGAGFVPGNYDGNYVDIICKVTDEDAFETMRLMAKEEGILAGISSGAAMHAAIKLAEKDMYANKNIVVILPDSGERYLSTGIF